MSCFCDLFYVGEEQNQEHDFHSFMDFCSLETVCFNILFKCLYFFHLFHSFSFTETQIIPLFRRIVSYETDLWIWFFHTLVPHFTWTYCSASICIRLLCNPDKDPRFCSATAFLIIFVYTSQLLKGTRDAIGLTSIRLDCGLVRVTCDLEGFQKRTSSCVKPLTNWVAIQ